jgi:hypothetical protein
MLFNGPKYIALKNIVDLVGWSIFGLINTAQSIILVSLCIIYIN